MEPVLFAKGAIAGFIIALPTGPGSVLIFRRVLTGSVLVGLFTVLGVATADTIYGLAAATGITAITHVIAQHRALLRVVAGVFLLGFGIMMIRAHPREKKDGDTSQNLRRAFFTGFALMIVNPVVIFSFLVVFTWLDLTAHHPGLLNGTLLAAGLFSGSSAWWGVYKLAFRWAGGPLRRQGVHAINLVAGILICGFGLWELIAAALRHH